MQIPTKQMESFQISGPAPAPASIEVRQAPIYPQRTVASSGSNSPNQQPPNINVNNKIETTNKEEEESYDIDTPYEDDIDSNADSYVNPLHSDKNVTDTDEDK
jgi:hypothetical protein